MTYLDSHMEVDAPRRRASSDDAVSSAVAKIIDVLRRRFWTLALVSLSLFALAVVATLLIPPKYEATARLKIDPNQQSSAAVTGQTVTGNPDQAVIDTEANIIRSRALAKIVAHKLKLETDPEFTRDIVRDTDTPTDPATQERILESIAGRLVTDLEVTRQPDTYIILITYRSADPLTAARVANGFADAYLDSSVGLRTGTAARQVAWLEKRMREVASEAEDAGRRLAVYRSENNIVDSAANQTITDQQVAPVATQLATAESAAAAARAQLQAARRQMSQGGWDAVTDVLSSSVVADLRRQRAEVLRNMGEVQTRYGARHPETLRVQQQLQSLDEQIEQEARRIMGGLASEAGAAEARAASLRSTLEQVRSEQGQNIRAAVLADNLQREADAKRTQYDRLAESAQNLQQVARNSMPQARIVEEAREPSSPSFPKKPLMFALGAVFALIFGGFTITLQELMSRVVRTEQDVEERLGIPLLTSVPQLKSETLAGHGEGYLPTDYLVDKPMTVYGEAFRTARATLLHDVDGGPKVIAVVSTMPGEGKTTTALSLARTMALSGDRVLLIDADLRRGGLASAAHIKPEVGLFEILNGHAHTEDVILRDVVDNLDLLPVAQSVFTPQDVFSGSKMASLLDTLRPRYDRIIFDTPPLLGIADAQTIATLSDSSILVLKWNSTPLEAAESALLAIETSRASVSGAIYSMVDPSAGPVAGYYSQAYSAYYVKD